MPGEVVRCPRARGHQLGEAWQYRWVLGEQRQVDAAPADRLEQREQACEYRFGLDGRRGGRGRGGAQELRHERVEALPRQGRQLQIARALPHAGERLDQGNGRAVASGGERGALCISRGGVEPDRRQRIGVVYDVLAEHCIEMPLDRVAVAIEYRGQRRGVCGAAGARQHSLLGGIRRQVVRLPVVAVLQAVLQIAQEHVRRRELGDGGAREEPAHSQRGERRQRTAQPQARLPAAAHELQRLRDEFDLADAARTKLDVAGVILAPALLADLPVHVAQTSIGVVIEILAKHERRNEPFQLVATLAGQGPRLEPRVALPGAPLRDQVLLERGERR